jgi:hypothetical protein
MELLMKIGGTLKVVVVAKMKLPVVCVLISLGFVSQAFAVLRPLFPAKPVPPYSGEVIIIGDDLVPGSKKNAAHSGTNYHNQMKEQLTKHQPGIQRKARFYSLVSSLVRCRCEGSSSLPFNCR